LTDVSNLTSRLWEIAHDTTEIPGGEFLEELKELGFEATQQTLSNYVRRGWVTRERVGTAPGGQGQTGYFKRQQLVPAVFAARSPRAPAADLDQFRATYKRDELQYIVRCLDALMIDRKQITAIFLANEAAGSVTAGAAAHVRGVLRDYFQESPFEPVDSQVEQELRKWDGGDEFVDAITRLIELRRAAFDEPVGGGLAEYESGGASRQLALELERFNETSDAMRRLLLLPPPGPAATAPASRAAASASEARDRTSVPATL
jgi:hypothetical protein